MKSKLENYRYYNGKRMVGGTAALLHFFKENGGVDNVITQVAYESAEHAVRNTLKILLHARIH